MELLVFAHRAEAQEFIRRFSFRPKDNSSSLYESAERLLLISGEGIYEVFSRIGQILGKYPVEKVVNLGIAGSLDPAIETGSFLSVRTVYCQSDQLQFQSFTLADPRAETDLITSSKRVLDDEYAATLSCFAPVVDRELWALAKTCSSAGIALYSYKLISDQAGSATACFDLKAKALEFSTALLEGYLALDDDPLLREESAIDYPVPMSFTQKARFRKTLSALKISEGFDEDIFWKKTNRLIEGLDKEGAPQKQKANTLLELMELELNPIKKSVKENFEKLAAPAKSIGAKLLFDKNFEKKKFTLQMDINGQKNIENLVEVLKGLRFSDFENVWSGERERDV